MRVTTPPGEVLKEEFMKPLGLSANMLARRLDVPPNRVTAVINGSRSITSDTALRLARAFGTTAEFWLNLQMAHDLSAARAAAGERIRETVRPFAERTAAS
ncbi:MAG: HigA family addiction module antidote protein [Alphaproteobacteria bacterium]|nr:HigA family addiction module antidote protein [Alphaproteobacteria bacterium]